MEEKLFQIVNFHFSSICEKFGLRQLELSPDCTAIVAENYALLLTHDRDGVSLWYACNLDEGENVVQIPLGHYLVSNRNWIKFAGLNNLESMVGSYSKTLLESAEDILRGEREWLENFGGYFYPAAPEICNLLHGSDRSEEINGGH